MRRHRAWTQAGLAALVIVASVSTLAALAINVARTNTAKALKAERLARSDAQTNFQTARSTVHDYLTTVSENTLLKQQDRTDLRALRANCSRGPESTRGLSLSTRTTRVYDRSWPMPTSVWAQSPPRSTRRPTHLRPTSRHEHPPDSRRRPPR